MAFRLTLYLLLVTLFYFYCRLENTPPARDIVNKSTGPIEETDLSQTTMLNRFKTNNSFSDSIQKNMFRPSPAFYAVPSLPSSE